MAHRRPLLRGKPGSYARALFLPAFLVFASVDAARPEPVSPDPAQTAVQPGATAADGKGEPPVPQASKDESPKKPAEALDGAKDKDEAPPAKALGSLQATTPLESKKAEPSAESAPAGSKTGGPAVSASQAPGGDAPSQGAAAPAETNPTAKSAGENAAAAVPPKEPVPLRVPKPPETKDAAAAAKPREIAPKLDAAEALNVQASSVNAVYQINWLGTYIGDFRIRSSVTNRQYSLTANADVSVFFGAVSWQGTTSSHGLMTANGPVPQTYNFRYSTNDRRESIDLRFQQRMVSDIIINPPQHPGSRNVPITAADLQNVLDPLSAVLLLSQARLNRQSAEACNKRLPIFDGKIRYDLVLSPKGTRAINSTGRLHGIAHVCRVNYVPIAGHKAGKPGADYATGNTGIEVWLVPVPEAGLLVPYYVNVPTPAGTASMVTAKFEIETPGGRHALAD